LERRIQNDRSELLVRDKTGKGLVHYAVRSGSIPTLDFLLSNGAGALCHSPLNEAHVFNYYGS